MKPRAGCRRRTPQAGHGLTRLTILAAGFLAAGLLVAGCATAPRGPGDDLLRRGDYAAAVPVLREALATRPDDPTLNRNLGIALLETGQAKEAVTALEKAWQANPKDSMTAFHLGRAAEAAGQLDRSAKAYGAYLELGGKHASAVRARLNAISRRRAEVEVKAAVAREASLSATSIPENTLAVPDFVNVAASDTLAPLSRGLAAILVTDLSKVGAFRVLERERLQVLLDELDLARPPAKAASTPARLHAIDTALGLKERLGALIDPDTGKPYYTGAKDDQGSPALVESVREFQADHGLTADGLVGPRTEAAMTTALDAQPPPEAPIVAAVAPDSAPRLGKILGARRFVQGAFTPLGEREIRLDASLVAAREGTLAPAGDPVSGPLPRILHLEKDLLAQILAALGVTPTEEERRVLSRIATDDFGAFMAWSQGLVYEDLGRREDALTSFREALRLDPGFREARESRDVAEVTSDNQTQVDHAELEQTAPAASEGDADRLLRTGAWGGLGPGPDFDRWADHDPTVTQTEKFGEGGGLTGTIFIGGDLPRRQR
jgi:tetratricopeptide (TPR) repeat protein